MVMNAVSKSGTNTFHGSLYGFLRNSAMDARNFTDPSKVPPFRRGQYGGTIGGPIKKDKLFFFGNYEGIHFLQGASQIVTVPWNPACTACGLTSTSTNPQSAAAVNAVLALYPLPTRNFNAIANTGSTAFPLGIGTGQTTVVANTLAMKITFWDAPITISPIKTVSSCATSTTSSTNFLPSAVPTLRCNLKTKMAATSFSTWKNGISSRPPS